MTVVTDKIQNHAGGPVEFVGQVAAKMWANYNGNIALLRDSFNVSSGVDLGTGFTELNLVSAMKDVNYCNTATCKYSVNSFYGNNTKAESYGRAAGVVNVVTMSSSTGNNYDCEHLNATVSGDLA
ncbi:hypothetical protein [Idiomarina abyssalis]|uniref:hypothetical protein n=1 Tax=Idiomarina abyssalis TaxID=86102 RepID=UPI003A90AE0D